MANRELNSDEIRDVLEEEISEYDISEGGSDNKYTVEDSDHDSDLDIESESEDSDHEIDESGSNSDNSDKLEDNFQPHLGNGDVTGPVRGRRRGAAIPQPDPWQQWREDDVSFDKFAYTQNSGFRPPPDFNRDSEIDYFSLFFTDNLLQEIVKETNRYTREKIRINTPLQKRSMWHSFTDVTLDEFKAFIGVIINMGLNPKTDIDEYFSNDWSEYYPFFKDIFSKERFYQIFWGLHLNPPPRGPVLGVLSRSGKVRNVIKYIDEKVREYYCPSNNVSVDESTIGFKGKISFKCYNKDKPTKWGMKVYVLADATNGYICAMELCRGSATKHFLVRPDLLTTTRIVLTLIDKLEITFGNMEGLHVFMDRYYNSVELSEELLKKNIHSTGTINRGRVGLPLAVKSQQNKMKRGEIHAYRKDDKVLVLQWKDKRPILMITTYYDTTTEEVRRIIKGGIEEIIRKPTVVCRYNDYMGGVDTADHYISSYGFTRKSLKWWRKIFFWLLEVAIVNSFILFNSNRPPGCKAFRQRKFRQRLLKQLVGDVRNTRKRGRPSDFDKDERLNNRLHSIYPLEDAGFARSYTKDCIVCSDRKAPGGRKRTKFFCKTCTSKPGLHPGYCFYVYHSKKCYK